MTNIINNNNETVQAMSSEILTTLQDINNLIAPSTRYAFRNHYVNTETGVCGIENLIADILTNANANFPAGIEFTPHRSIAIGNSMFASEIIEIVRQSFGPDRYTDGTIHHYLSVFMTKKDLIGKIKLSNVEDKDRPCCKPRIKFYLVEQTA